MTKGMQWVSTITSTPPSSAASDVYKRQDIAYMRDMLYSLTTDIEPMYLREIRRKEESVVGSVRCV
ncbi:hypothetical protein [Staphylococcus aureus]|uniref:hypothetical protein n=1 Tax=Staphylococcus aureus TaxID=1280 RepID=UPI003B58881F